jgi:hypothetical protein
LEPTGAVDFGIELDGVGGGGGKDGREGKANSTVFIYIVGVLLRIITGTCIFEFLMGRSDAKCLSINNNQLKRKAYLSQV